MKTGRSVCPGVAKILLWICPYLLSCTQFYFVRPQPVDRKNIYHFPKAFRGNWEGKDDSTTINFSSEIPLDSTGSIFPPPPDTTKTIETDTSEHMHNLESIYFTIKSEGDSSIFKSIDSATYAEEMRKDSIHALDLDSGSITIKRKFIQFIIIHDERIDKESVIIAGTKEDQDLQAYNKEYHQIRDSLPTPVGKKFSYLLKGDMIYEIKKKGLGQGHLYASSGKEIIVHCIDTAITELGHNAFLRKLDKNFWVLNICSSDSDEDARWWGITILEKTKHGTMRAWDCDSKLERHPSMFYTTGRYFENYYFDCQWSASEMLQLIHDGYFTQTDLWYRRH